MFNLNNMKYLVSNNSNGNIVAIVLAKEWFKELYRLNKMPFFIEEDDYVVCRWNDFHDGEKSNIEGMETIAICKTIKDAGLIYIGRTRKVIDKLSIRYV